MKRMGKIAAALIAACTLFSGASVAVADQAAPSTNTDQQATPAAAGYPTGSDQVSVSNVRVSDIGAHTANISFDYSIDPSLLPQIKNVCFVAALTNIIQVTATSKMKGYGLGPNYADVDCSGGTSDEDLTPESYERIYGIYNQPYNLGGGVGSIRYQSFNRYYANSWDGKANGTFSLTLIGLTANTQYGTNEINIYGDYKYVDFRDMALSAIEKAEGKLNVPTAVDARQLFAGLHIDLKNGDYIPLTFNAQSITDLKTTAEPESKPTTSDLTEQNKGSVTVPDSTVKPGSVARIYVANLAKECAAKVDAGEDCFWYSYIYSDPVKLTGPDGSPYVTIKKDENGKYYYDAFIPANYSGSHKIALQDEKGNIQGWTDVTVGEKTPTPTPTPADKAALNKAIAAADKLVKADYTEATWTPFAKALEEAKAVAAKADAKQAEVDAAAKTLVNAQAALKKAEKTPSKDENKPSDDKTDTTVDAGKKPTGDKSDVQPSAKPVAQKKIASTGASVAAMAVTMIALACAGAAVLVRRRA